MRCTGSLLVLASMLAIGCGGSADRGAANANDDGGLGHGDTDGAPGSPSNPIGPDGDAGTPAVDAGGGASPPVDSGSPLGTGSGPGDDAGAAPPARNGQCTPLSDQNGTVVDTSHGRLDGTLVYVLPIDGSNACNGDSSHVHLQIEVSGSVYDVAIDVGKTGDEVGWYEQTMAIPGGTWAEGWHGSDDLGYPSLGLSSSTFTTLDPASMGSEVESLLASTSKISIFCTGYTPGDNGCHDVHYENGSTNDGAIVLDPTAATSPIVFFRFTTETF
jgi:hypothetical protein